MQVDRTFVSAPAAGWAFCIEYLDGPVDGGRRSGKRIDYKELLSPDQFTVFSRLRETRKRLAEEEGVPVYAVFTNEQLAAIVRAGIKEVSGLTKIQGVGEAKTEKYGAAMVAAIAETLGEAREG